MSNRCRKCGSFGTGSIHTGASPPWKVCRRCGRAWGPELRWWVAKEPEGRGWQIYQVGSLPSPRVGVPVRWRWKALRNLQGYVLGIQAAQEMRAAEALRLEDEAIG